VAVVSRVVDWFWQVSAERAAQVPGPGPTSRVLELAARAALAQEAAARTARPAEPFAQPGSEALACELYRQAIHWALLAHAALSERTAPADAGAASEGSPAGDAAAAREAPVASDLGSLLERTDPALLSRAAGGDAALAELRAELARATYREFAELPPREQKKLAERLEAFGFGLTEPLAGLRQRLERVWVRRALHVLALLGLLVVAVWGVRDLLAWRERQSDLAVKATWTTSSSYPVGGCKSPLQHCVGGENYFFHTNQETNPWVMFDLHKVREVSGVEIDNRLDCCLERAKTLVVEVSNDQRRWKQVAQHDGEFMTLRRHFSTVKARYVRIVVPQQAAILHLSQVRIFP
jgi:F5/8 type C domain-containing protein